MKSRFEKQFRQTAYSRVPDKWEDVREKVGVTVPDAQKTKVVKFNARVVASVAASVTIVLTAVSVAVGLGGRHRSPEKGTTVARVAYTDEHGETQTHEASGSDSIDVPETTVITYVDGEGKEHSTVAAVMRGDDKHIVVSFTDNEGNTQTAVLDIPAETTTTVPSPSSTDTSPQADPATTPTTTQAEIVSEIDWDKRSITQKFPAVQFDPDDLPNGMGKEYTFPWLDSAKTSTRSATRLYGSYTLRNTNPKTDKIETTTADIYTFQGFSKKLVVGVKFAGESYPHPYVNGSYVPQTLGEFLSATDYDNTIRYGNIRLHKDGTFPVNDKNKADIRKYLLSDSSVKNTNVTDRPTGAKVTLNVSMDELGRYNKVMEIYESGYVYTNLIGYGYCFNVGRENVAAFLKNSYNVTFADLTQMNAATQSTPIGDTTASQPYFVQTQVGTTVMTTHAQTVPE